MSSVEAYRGLVERLEVEARESPGNYKVKVALLAALGFLVLGGAVLLALGLSVGLVAVLVAISPILLLKLAKVVWIPIGFGWLVLRALWVKLSPPEGYRLAADEAPELQVEVERLRIAASAPKLAGILIDADLNAAAASVPRMLGLLGHRHYLVIGLPLMQLLDRAQFSSVIAHEFGHFGGGHGHFSGWIYRVRVSWYRLLQALSAQGSWASSVFVKFFDWYAPYFNAYSFVLARDNEYQADATAARIAGPHAAGQALLRVNVGSERLERDFWPALQQATRALPQPPALMYRDMAHSLHQTHIEDGERLARRLAQSPDYDDTHPTLAQRLRALGVAVEDVPPPQRTAAEELLGELLPQLEQRFSQEWRGHVEEGWQERHRQHAVDSDRLGELEGMAERTPDETVEHARLAEELHPQVDALPLFRRAVEGAPESAFAHFRLGVLMLERDDADGVVHLRRAMALEPGSVEVVLHHLDDHYRRTGDHSGREYAHAELQNLYRAHAKSARSRGELTSRDVFEPHGLDADTLRRVQEALDHAGKVGCAWIARKVIVDDPGGLPHFAVLLKWRGMLWSESSALARVVEALDLPGSFIAFTAPHQRRIAKRVRKAAGEAVYRGRR